MPTIPIRRTLRCTTFLALAACNSALPPTPEKNALPAFQPSAAASATSVTAGGTTLVAPANVANAPPSRVEHDLLDAAVATAEDTLESIRQRFGAANVKDDKVPGAEGVELPGWILYPDDPTRRVYIYPDDSGKHPSLLRVLDGESTWRRSDGIRMGLTLTELAARNGQPIQFSGFGWDYGGAIHDWHGGAMEKSVGSLTLCPPDFPDDQYPENYPSGDSEFSSSDDLVVRYPPIVCEFAVVLESDGKP